MRVLVAARQRSRPGKRRVYCAGFGGSSTLLYWFFGAVLLSCLPTQALQGARSSVISANGEEVPVERGDIWTSTMADDSFTAPKEMTAVLAKDKTCLVTKQPVPEPGPREYLIQIHWTAVNRADTLQRKCVA